MSYFTPGNRDYDSPFYDEDSAGEIVKLYRHEYERQLRDLQRIDRFLDSLTPARAINVSESAAMSTQFPRLRDELWWKGREWFQKRDCNICGDEALKKELGALKP